MLLNVIGDAWGKLCTQMKRSLCGCGVCARLHGVRLYCADRWCMLSLTERETADPFVSALPGEKSTERAQTEKNQLGSSTYWAYTLVLRWIDKRMNEQMARRRHVSLWRDTVPLYVNLHRFKAETCIDWLIRYKSKENATSLELPTLAIYTQFSHSVTA